MEQRGRILGIGGVFFKSANRDQMREWYSKHLGLADKGQGVTLPWRERDDPQKEHVTAWTIFPASTDYIPATQPFMVNYIVDDLDALLDRLKPLRPREALLTHGLVEGIDYFQADALRLARLQRDFRGAVPQALDNGFRIVPVRE